MAVVAALTGERAQADVVQLLRGSQGPPRIAAVNLGEVFDVMVRVKSWRRGRVDLALSWLTAGGLDVVSTNEQIARTAGDLRSRFYDRTACPVSLSDCVALATAQLLREPLATADTALAASAQLEGALLIPLPNSSGQRPPVVTRPPPTSP
jgi:PIN domain nuclease of toxin-antitoxin system